MTKQSLSLLTFLASTVAHADAVDDRIVALMAERQVPGLSFAVVEGGAIARVGAYGVESLETPTPVTASSRFEIASMSKMFLGTAVKILIDEGKIELDAPITRYVDGIPEAWRAMKVRHLISMTAGVLDDWDAIPFGEVRQEYDDRSMLSHLAGTMKLVSPPGRVYHYGFGYFLLSLAVQRVTGDNWQAFVRKRVFEPADMDATSYVDAETVIPHRVQGYRVDKGRYLRGFFVAQYMHSRADVGILTTPTDYAKYLQALDKGLIVKSPGELWTPLAADDGSPMHYAFGWMDLPLRGLRAVHHTGGYRTGFTSMVVRFPDEDLSIIVAANRHGAPVRAFVDLIADAYVVPLPAGSTTDTNPERTRRLIAVLHDLAAGKPDFGVVDEGGLIYSVPEWIEYLEGISHATFVEAHPAPGELTFNGHAIAQIVTLSAKRSGTPLTVRFYLRADGRVAHIGE